MRVLLFKLVLRLFALLPLRVAHALGAGLGWLAWVLPTGLRDTTLTNLRLCFPDMPEPERRRLARASLRETGKTFTEMGAMWFWSPAQVYGLVRETVNEDMAVDLYRQGRGLIVLIPHLGSWEMCNLHYAQDFPLTALYRPPRMAGLQRMIQQSRERVGARLVPTTAGGVKGLYAALGRHEVVGILPDQDPGRGGGVFAPFFGIPASTMTLVPRLAQRTGAPVVLIYGERLPKGRGYRTHFHPVGDAIRDADPAVAAAALNRGVETCVRECPSQYQWSYRRFKTRPEGEESLY